MTTTNRPSKALHITLWLVQVLLAASLLWGASMKLFQPTDKLALMWPWVLAVPAALLKFTAVVDVLGALGLILPALTGIKPRFVPVAAMCVAVLMALASAFHLSRGESIAPNVAFAVMALFVAWGRWRRVQ